MTRYIPESDVIKIFADSYILHIYVGRWFPNTKPRLTKLLKLMYENDRANDLETIMMLLLNKLNHMHDNPQADAYYRRLINNNIKTIKVFNGLHGYNPGTDLS